MWLRVRAAVSDDVVTRAIALPASRDDVWRALTSPDELSAWLGEVLELEPRAGGAVVVREPDGTTRRGVVEAAEPGRALVLRWRRLSRAGGSLEVGAATRVVFRLDDDPAGTLLTVHEEPVPLATMGVGM